MQKNLLLVGLFISAIFLFDCSSTKEIGKNEPPVSTHPPVKKAPSPDMTITVANIDLATVPRKIEKKDIEQLAKILREHKVDIFTVQGISRYPEIKTRLDVVDEITSSADMRSAFGENINLSGRQTGNAIFTTYPIRSQWNVRYEGIRSNNFESSLQAVIDCGVRDIVVVSTRLPDKSSVEDQTTCVTTLSSFKNYYIDDPIIVTGNLPSSNVLRALTKFNSAKNPKHEEGSRIWFSNDGSLILLNLNVDTTALKPVVIAEFGVFRKPRP
jgi:hypothetical protein